MSTVDSTADGPPPAATAARATVAGPSYIAWTALALMTVSSVASLRPAPTMAVYGLACVFLYVLPAIVFLIPTALISAELASGWSGGIYAWVTEGISPRMGFTAAWHQYAMTLFYYPSLLSFVAATLAYVSAPDLATDGQAMAWIMDTWAMTTGISAPGVVTGKPVALGGTPLRGEATARGALLCIREACASIKKPLKGATVVVQGFGSAGSGIARLMAQEGARVVAVSDSRGGAHSAKGLDLAQLQDHKRQAGSVAGFKGAERITNEELLELKCDVLVPAAVQGQLTVRNASSVRARIVAEAANGPTLPAADRILREHGVVVVPDILCGAGGAAVSYLEWAQNAQGRSWEEGDVARELDKAMKRAFSEVHQLGQRAKVDLRTAATMLAVGRVAEAVRLRGLFP